MCLVIKRPEQKHIFLSLLFLFFFSGWLWLRGLLRFHTNLMITCSISLRNAIETLMGIALNPYRALGDTAILTMLILSTRGHGLSFHFFPFLLQLLR